MVLQPVLGLRSRSASADLACLFVGQRLANLGPSPELRPPYRAGPRPTKARSERISLSLGGLGWFVVDDLLRDFPLLGVVGAEGWTDLFSGKMQWSDPKVTEAMKLFAKMQDYLNPDHSTLSWDQAVKALMEGKVAFNSMGDWADGEFLKAQMKEKEDFGWVSYPDTDGSFIIVADGFTLAKGVPHPEAGLAWLMRSQDFLTKISHPSTYKDAVNMIEANNQSLPKPQKWIVLPFKAQFILSADHTTYGRLLILVPNLTAANGDKLDQWILFSIATPEMDPNIEIHNVSIIAIRRDTHTGPGITYMSYPVDFLRQEDPQSDQINIVPTMLLAKNPSKNCYECHKTGVLPIHPNVEYTFDTGGKLPIFRILRPGKPHK
jgi:Bacterial extracellular solute-binding protein